jgi:uncharacterized membrane protein (DUF485 family)
MARDVDDVQPDPPPTGSAAEAVGQDPDLEELQRRHRGFVFPATLFTLVFYMALILAAAYAPGFMSKKVVGAINVAYLFALAQFVMTFVIAYLYTRFARTKFDPLQRELLAKLHARQGDAR